MAPQRTTVYSNRLTVDITACPGTQIHNHARNVLGPTQPQQRIHSRKLLLPPAQLQQPRAHLGREEARTDTVHGDMPRAQLDGQVAPQVNDAGLAGRVAKGAVLAQAADAEPGDAGGDEHAAGVVEGGARLQQRRKEAHGVEDGLDIQVEDFAKGAVWVGVEGLAPGGAGVGEQDVDVGRVLPHAVDEGLHALDGGAVGRYGDGLRAGRQARQAVERLHGFLAGGGFARRDEDFGAACLEEATGRARVVVLLAWVGKVGAGLLHSLCHGCLWCLR